jgi:hypothetical protein
VKDPYPSEKFGKALDTLVVANELLGGRIRDAFEFELYKIRPGHHHLPDEVARQLGEYQDAVGRFGGTAAWVESLDDVAKQRVARWIQQAYEDIEADYKAA